MKGNVSKARHQQPPLCAFGQPGLPTRFDVKALDDAHGGAVVMVIHDILSADMPDTLDHARALFPAVGGYTIRIEVAGYDVCAATPYQRGTGGDAA